MNSFVIVIVLPLMVIMMILLLLFTGNSHYLWPLFSCLSDTTQCRGKSSLEKCCLYFGLFHTQDFDLFCSIRCVSVKLEVVFQVPAVCMATPHDSHKRRVSEYFESPLPAASINIVLCQGLWFMFMAKANCGQGKQPC